MVNPETPPLASGAPRNDPVPSHGSIVGLSGYSPVAEGFTQVLTTPIRGVRDTLHGLQSSVRKYLGRSNGNVPTASPPDMEDMAMALACMKASNVRQPGQDCPIACRFLSQGGNRELLCKLAEEQLESEPSPGNPTAQPRDKGKGRAPEPAPSSAGTPTFGTPRTGTTFDNEVGDLDDPSSSVVRAQKAAWDAAKGGGKRGHTAPGLSSTPAPARATPMETLESPDVRLDYPMSPNPPGDSPMSPDLWDRSPIGDIVGLNRHMGSDPTSPDILDPLSPEIQVEEHWEGDASPNIGSEDPVSSEVLSECFDSPDVRSPNPNGRQGQGVPATPGHPTERPLHFSPVGRDDVLAQMLAKMTVMEQVLQGHTQALSEGLCMCRDPKTCPCTSRNCGGSRDAAPSAGVPRERGPSLPPRAPIYTRHRREYSGSEVAATTASDTDDSVSSLDRRRPAQKRPEYSPFGEKVSEAPRSKRRDEGEYEYRQRLPYLDVDNVDYTKSNSYRVQAVKASKASASAAEAPQASPSYGYVNPTAWNMASKGVVAPKWDNKVENWAAFRKAWAKHMSLLAGAPPALIRHNFILCLPEEEQERWSERVQQSPSLTWEKIQAELDGECAWDMTLQNSDALKNIRHCQEDFSDLRVWRNLFLLRVGEQDDLSPSAERQALLSKLPLRWQNLVLVEENKLSTKSFGVKVSGAPIQEQDIVTVGRQKRLPRVDHFRLLRNGITFRCESLEDQASWVDYLNGRSYLLGKQRVILHASSSHIVMSSNNIFYFLMGRARGQARMEEEKRALQGQSVAHTHSVGGRQQ